MEKAKQEEEFYPEKQLAKEIYPDAPQNAKTNYPESHSLDEPLIPEEAKPHNKEMAKYPKK